MSALSSLILSVSFPVCHLSPPLRLPLLLVMSLLALSLSSWGGNWDRVRKTKEPFLWSLLISKIHTVYIDWHSLASYEVLSENSRSVIVVTASLKEDERRGQGHTSASLLHQSATWHSAVNMHCFYMSAFLTLSFIMSAMDGKFEQHVCIKFCVRLGKSTTETHEMLCEAFGEHSLSQTAVFEWHSQFKASWRWRMFRATKHQQNDRKC
jgi:hypothetical protein